MSGRYVFGYVLSAVIVWASLGSSQAFAIPGTPGMTRSEVRAMPITERPYRPGHFYGNTVRRRAGR